MLRLRRCSPHLGEKTENGHIEILFAPFAGFLIKYGGKDKETQHDKKRIHWRNGGVCGYCGYEWLQTGAMHVRPLLLAGGFSLVMGVQFGSLGLLGEMMVGNKKQSFPVSDTFRDA